MITFASARRTPPTSDVVVLAVFSDRADSRPSDLDWPSIEARGFEGKAGQVQVATKQGNTLVAVVGLGEIDKVDATAVRKAGAAIAKALKKHKTIATPLLEDLPARLDRNVAAQALAEGIVLGSYSFERYKSEGAKPSAITRVVTVGEGRGVTAALQTGAQIAQGVNFARDLINEPGGTLTPAEMTKRAVAMARQAGLKVIVHDEAAIKAAQARWTARCQPRIDESATFRATRIPPTGARYRNACARRQRDHVRFGWSVDQDDAGHDDDEVRHVGWRSGLRRHVGIAGDQTGMSRDRVRAHDRQHAGRRRDAPR